jgi:hypothetical protein
MPPLFDFSMLQNVTHVKLKIVTRRRQMREKRLTTKEAAVILGYSHMTLKKWRQGRKEWELGLRGPKFKSVHGRVFYTEDALEDWLKLCGGD